MTRQPKKPAKTKLPKPVEAWGIVTHGRLIRDVWSSRAEADLYAWDEENDEIIRVRIVPVKPKKRRVRKEKQK